MPPTGSTPQFDTAEYSSAGEVCKFCKQALTGDYYRLNGITACASCTQQVRGQRPLDTPPAFIKAVVFGIGAAILGCALYAGFTIVTHIYIGFVSLGVGWLVAKAMEQGSGGIGGRRYQIVAVALTYLAVSMAEIPIALHAADRDLSALAVAASWGRFLMIGIASPFAELSENPVNGILGLVILFVGMRIAWRMTAGPKLEILGPFRTSSVGTLPTSVT